VDASHGGGDVGETLNASLLEKDLTVALARSLRQELESRGITTLVLRDSDADLSLDQRAMFANADHAAIYIALHAASNGHGVRVYTALLPYGDDDRGPFRSWTAAQHASLPLTRSTASAVAAELLKRQIPVRTLGAPLRPLNNVTGPAIDYLAKDYASFRRLILDPPTPSNSAPSREPPPSPPRTTNS
jgi:N-acetylmuramoyl-L-alanine amidase